MPVFVIASDASNIVLVVQQAAVSLNKAVIRMRLHKSWHNLWSSAAGIATYRGVHSADAYAQHACKCTARLYCWVVV